MTKYLFALLLLSVSCFASQAGKLWTGRYVLSGDNTKWSGAAYDGEVNIQKQGENYSLVWQVGTRQTHVGIGIVYDDILSVAFADAATGKWGVASYRILSNGELDGRWTGYEGTAQKPEYLVWKGY